MTYDRLMPANARGEQETTLRILNAIERNSALSQRSISEDLGIALGLANSYLKRCVKKGLIKITQAPANRYAYYLTPQGFTEKGRLTTEFLRQSFFLFRAARQEYGDMFRHCADNGWYDVVLCGTGEVGEIAVLSAVGGAVRLRGFLDPHAQVTEATGLPVHHDLSAFPDVDVLVITDLHDPQGTLDSISTTFPTEKILAPQFMHLLRGGLHFAEDSTP